MEGKCKVMRGLRGNDASVISGSLNGGVLEEEECYKYLSSQVLWLDVETTVRYISK